MSDARFVQFMHPGHEHRPDQPGWKSWNTRDHRRKFLRSLGQYRCEVDAPDQRGDVTFWGEWEAQSRVTGLPPSDSGPRWLHSPLLQVMSGYRGAQNTDPFVFGDRFLDTCCKQRPRSGRPTQLRYLPHGSLVLFNSHISGGFGIDTVFVVDDHADHVTPSDGSDHVPNGYVHTTLRGPR